MNTIITFFLQKGSNKDKSDTQYFYKMFVHYKCYILIQLTFLKKRILIKQVHQRSEIFATIGIS